MKIYLILIGLFLIGFAYGESAFNFMTVGMGDNRYCQIIAGCGGNATEINYSLINVSVEDVWVNETGDEMTGNLTMDTDRHILFRNANQKIYSNIDTFLRLESPILNIRTNFLIYGDGTSDDFLALYDGTTNNGYMGWAGDLDYFLYTDEIMMDENRSIHFREKQINISSPSTGILNIVSPSTIIDSDTTFIKNTNITQNATIENSIKFNQSDFTTAPQIQYNGTCINMQFGTSGNGGLHICEV